MVKIKSSEITPEHVYLSRREFMKGIGALALTSLAMAACGGTGTPFPLEETRQENDPQPTSPATENAEGLTPYETVINFNNFYEFTTDKGKVASLAENFIFKPWTVAVGGLVKKPKIFEFERLLAMPQEERIYRLRCVEGWSMVIPWQGFPLNLILKEVEPTSDAQFVRFETLYDPTQFPGQKNKGYTWPYAEGLRLDEAMHDLTILSTGLYGKTLLPQNGAPLRLVIPWKYGYKSIKSIVRIDLVAEMPQSFWMAAVPDEYGFYANVNPDVPHPRWSQATEWRFGESDRIPTLMFNGYADEVASLYEGMD